jgi:hypothetical protein
MDRKKGNDASRHQRQIERRGTMPRHQRRMAHVREGSRSTLKADLGAAVQQFAQFTCLHLHAHLHRLEQSWATLSPTWMFMIRCSVKLRRPPAAPVARKRKVWFGLDCNHSVTNSGPHFWAALAESLRRFVYEWPFEGVPGQPWSISTFSGPHTNMKTSMSNIGG